MSNKKSSKGSNNSNTNSSNKNQKQNSQQQQRKGNTQEQQTEDNMRHTVTATPLYYFGIGFGIAFSISLAFGFAYVSHAVALQHQVQQRYPVGGPLSKIKKEEEKKSLLDNLLGKTKQTEESSSSQQESESEQLDKNKKKEALHQLENKGKQQTQSWQKSDPETQWQSLQNQLFLDPNKVVITLDEWRNQWNQNSSEKLANSFDTHTDSDNDKDDKNKKQQMQKKNKSNIISVTPSQVSQLLTLVEQEMNQAFQDVLNVDDDSEKEPLFKDMFDHVQNQRPIVAQKLGQYLDSAFVVVKFLCYLLPKLGQTQGVWVEQQVEQQEQQQNEKSENNVDQNQIIMNMITPFIQDQARDVLWQLVELRIEFNNNKESLYYWHGPKRLLPRRIGYLLNAAQKTLANLQDSNVNAKPVKLHQFYWSYGSSSFLWNWKQMPLAVVEYQSQMDKQSLKDSKIEHILFTEKDLLDGNDAENKIAKLVEVESSKEQAQQIFKILLIEGKNNKSGTNGKPKPYDILNNALSSKDIKFDLILIPVGWIKQDEVKKLILEQQQKQQQSQHQQQIRFGINIRTSFTLDNSTWAQEEKLTKLQNVLSGVREFLLGSLTESEKKDQEVVRTRLGLVSCVMMRHDPVNTVPRDALSLIEAYGLQILTDQRGSNNNKNGSLSISKSLIQQQNFGAVMSVQASDFQRYMNNDNGKVVEEIDSEGKIKQQEVVKLNANINKDSNSNSQISQAHAHAHAHAHLLLIQDQLDFLPPLRGEAHQNVGYELASFDSISNDESSVWVSTSPEEQYKRHPQFPEEFPEEFASSAQINTSRGITTTKTNSNSTFIPSINPIHLQNLPQYRTKFYQNEDLIVAENFFDEITFQKIQEEAKRLWLGKEPMEPSCHLDGVNRTGGFVVDKKDRQFTLYDLIYGNVALSYWVSFIYQARMWPSDFPIELREYGPVSKGMGCHRDLQLYKYMHLDAEFWFTVFSRSPNHELTYYDRQNMKHTLKPQPNTLLMVKPNWSLHCAGAIDPGQDRSLLKWIMVGNYGKDRSFGHYSQNQCGVGNNNYKAIETKRVQQEKEIGEEEKEKLMSSDFDFGDDHFGDDIKVVKVDGDGDKDSTANENDKNKINVEANNNDNDKITTKNKNKDFDIKGKGRSTGADFGAGGELLMGDDEMGTGSGNGKGMASPVPPMPNASGIAPEL